MPDKMPNQTPDKRERDVLIKQMLEKMRKQLQTELPEEHATLDQIEEAVSRIGDALLPELQQRLVNKGTRGKARDNQSTCSCGHRGRYKEMQKRTLVTVHGLVELVRPYYYCAHCRKGFAPLDAALQLDEDSTSTKMRTWAAEIGAKEAFAEGAQTLLSLTGVSLCAATIERITVSAGKRLQALQHQQVQALAQERLPEPKGRRPQRLYIGMDGLMVPLRAPWKKDKSLGDLSCRYGECKLGIVYETFVGKKGDERVRLHAYTATLADVQAFAPELALLAHHQGYGFARDPVVLGDGALWIWQLAARYFPRAVQIVDFFHACDHLSTVAEAIFGKGTAASRLWQKGRKEDLLSDRVVDVLRAIAAWKPTSPEGYALRRRAFGYFRRNAQRMRYGTFGKHGYHIGSGVVEAACKHVVALRLDQAGMHWREDTAEAVVRLRAALRSTYPPDLAPLCRGFTRSQPMLT